MAAANEANGPETSRLEGSLDLMLSNRTSRARYQGQEFSPAERPGPARGALSALHPFAVCWVVFLILTPIYVFESGLPQPADGLMAIMILVLATGYFVRVPLYGNLYLIAAIVLTYIALVNWFWYAFYFDLTFLFTSSYYLYNLAVVVLVLSLLARFGTRFLAVTKAGLAAALAIELIACLVVPTGSVREIGTFNNPNQLGYWSLAALACWLVLKEGRRLGVGDLIVIAVSGQLVALSLSKAALLSYFALVAVGMIAQGLRVRLGWTVGLVVAVVIPLLALQPVSMTRILEQDGVADIVDRLEGIGKQDAIRRVSRLRPPLALPRAPSPGGRRGCL